MSTRTTLLSTDSLPCMVSTLNMKSISKHTTRHSELLVLHEGARLSVQSMSNISQDAGHGKITAQIHNNQVVFPVLSYTYPLKLLSPRMQREGVGVVYMMTYGGGLVGGDHISLAVNIEHDVRLVLLSQVRLSKGLITLFAPGR